MTFFRIESFKQDKQSCCVDQIVQIPNGTHQLIQTVQVSDPNTILLVIVTTALAIATLIVAFVTHRGNKETNRQTRESNKILRLEIESRFRPTLVFENVGHWVGKKDNKIVFGGYLKNFGSVPARNIQCYNFKRKTEITLDELITYEHQGEDNIKKRMYEMGALFPNASLFYTSSESFDENSQYWNLAIWLEYEFLDDKKEETIHIFSISTTTMELPRPVEAFLVKSFTDVEIKKARDDHDRRMKRDLGIE